MTQKAQHESCRTRHFLQGDFWPASLKVVLGRNFRVARENEAAGAADAAAWVISAVLIFGFR